MRHFPSCHTTSELRRLVWIRGRQVVRACLVLSLLMVVLPTVMATPARGATCSSLGSEFATPSITLRCIRNGKRGLRWSVVSVNQAAAGVPASSTTSTVAQAAPRAPQVSDISVNESRVRFTLSGMSPDTGNYAVQWVERGRSFSSYRMMQSSQRSVSIDSSEFACGGRSYHFRVFVMRADWTLAQGHQSQNVTPHSEVFEIATASCPIESAATSSSGATTTTTTTTTIPLTCAQGGVCEVGQTGPGGGKVFYVAGSTFTSSGSDCGSSCRYLEVATSDLSTGIVWATNTSFCYAAGSSVGNQNCQSNSVYSNTAGQATSRTASEAIGMGMANTTRIHTRLTAAGDVSLSSYAAGLAWDYSNNGKSDWHLPSKDELNQLYLARTAIGGLAFQYYWSSSELDDSNAWRQSFVSGFQVVGAKNSAANYVRVVRAFG